MKGPPGEGEHAGNGAAGGGVPGGRRSGRRTLEQLARSGNSDFMDGVALASDAVVCVDEGRQLSLQVVALV